MKFFFKNFQTSPALALTVLMLIPAHGAEAYYDDMHYHFTYYMARSVGYTPEQAYRIASANVSIDWDPETEPVQQNGQFAMWGMAANSYALDSSGAHWSSIRKSWVSITSTPRIKFHAMMDCLNWPLCHSNPSHQAKALEKIPLYRNQIWRSAKANGNLGGFLHFLEDEPAHEGYPSDNGHWAAVDMWWHNNQLRMGSATDYIDFDGNDGNRDTIGLINEVLRRMSEFMTIIAPKQAAKTPAQAFSTGAIRSVYRDLRKVNPVTNAPGFQETAHRVAAIANGEMRTQNQHLSAFPVLQLVANLGLYAGDFWEIWKAGSEPRNQPAYSVISRALNNELKSLETHYPFKHFQYDLDENGNPVGQHMVDKWVLAGNLHLGFMFYRDGKQEFSGREITVIIKSIPTFKGEKPYVLGRDESQGTMLFENLPIGNVKVEVYTLGRLLRERTVTLLKQNTYMDLRIDLDSEQAQLDLDKHLERMRLLMVQLRNSQVDYEKLDVQTRGLLSDLNFIVNELGALMQEGDKGVRLQEEARQLVELFRRESDWSEDIDSSLQLVRRLHQEAEGEKELVCAINNDLEAQHKDVIDQSISSCKTSITRLKGLLADAEVSLIKQKLSFDLYRDFFDRLERLNNSSPETFSRSLEDLYEQSDANIKNMADLSLDIAPARREIDSIYEFASLKIDQALDKISDRENYAKTKSDLSTTGGVYEELRSLFIDMYRESQTINVQHAAASHRSALDEIAQNWSAIEQMQNDYKALYSNLELVPVDAVAFSVVKNNVEESYRQLQLIKKLLHESQICMASLVDSGGADEVLVENEAPGGEEKGGEQESGEQESGEQESGEQESGEQESGEQLSEAQDDKEKRDVDMKVALPDVIGLSYNDAVAAIEAVGLVSLPPELGSSAINENDVGKVEVALPTVDGQLYQGDQIILQLFGESVASGNVPNVIGMDLREAADAIEFAGFAVVLELGSETTDKNKENTVAIQKPPPGSEIEAGRDVTLIIYSLTVETRIVPNLQGMPLKTAQEVLQSSDLFIDPYLEEAAPRKSDEGKVYKQYPEQGLDVMNGIAISVWVYGDFEAPEKKPDESISVSSGVPLITFPSQMLAGLNRAISNGNGIDNFRLPSDGNIHNPGGLPLNRLPERRGFAVFYRGEYMESHASAGAEIILSVSWLEPDDSVTGTREPNCASRFADRRLTRKENTYVINREISILSPETYAYVGAYSYQYYDYDVPRNFESVMIEAASELFDQIEPYAKKCTDGRGAKQNKKELWEANDIDYGSPDVNAVDEECAGLLGMPGSCDP